MPTVIEINETDAIGDKLELTVKLCGSVASVTRWLIHGMPREAMLEFNEALKAELDKRAAATAEET